MGKWDSDSSEDDGSPKAQSGYPSKKKNDWDDDSDEDGDWEKPSPVKKKAADSESEEDWEKKSVEEEEPKAAKSPEKAKPKTKKKKKKQEALDDPVAEKMRLLKLQQKGDKEMAGDLFGGEFARSDAEDSEEEEDEEESEARGGSDDDDDETPTKVIHSFDDLTLRRHGDVEQLVALMKKKFDQSLENKWIKGPYKTYFEAMTSSLEIYFTEQETQSIIEKVKRTISEKKKALAAKEKAKEEAKKKEDEEKKEEEPKAAVPKPKAAGGKKKNKWADKEDVGVIKGNDDGFYDAFM